MRIFYGFLIILSAAILWMLPITEGVYDFRTDVKEDAIRYETGGAETTANVTLLKAVYDDDQTTIDVTSDNSSDTPVVVDYTSGTRLLDISGLAVSANRTFTVSYDIDALSASTALTVLLDRIGWIWMVSVIGLAPAALVAMFMKRG